MSTQPFEPNASPSAGLVQINAGIEDVIQKRLAEERARLEREAGVVKRESHQFKRPVEHPFTKEQRSRTTLLGLALDDASFAFQAGALFSQAFLDDIFDAGIDLDQTGGRCGFRFKRLSAHKCSL